MKEIVLNLLLFLFSSFCLAQEEMETDRPDQTECASLVAPGFFQVETGFVYSKNNFKEVSALFCNDEFDYLTTLIRIGVFKNAELRIEAGEYQQLKTQTENNVIISEGFKPFEIGTKIHIAEEKGIIPKIVFIGHLELPVGSKNLRSENVTPSFRFSMAHTITNKISFGYNLGMEWEPDSSIPVYVYTSTIGMELSEKISCYIESFGGFSSGSFPESCIDGGFSFSPLPNIMVDISGGAGLNNYSNDYYLSVGFSFRLPK